MLRFNPAFWGKGVDLAESHVLGESRFASFPRDRDGILSSTLSCYTAKPLAFARIKWFGPIPAKDFDC